MQWYAYSIHVWVVERGSMAYVECLGNNDIIEYHQ